MDALFTGVVMLDLNRTTFISIPLVPKMDFYKRSFLSSFKDMGFTDSRRSVWE